MRRKPSEPVLVPLIRAPQTWIRTGYHCAYDLSYCPFVLHSSELVGGAAQNGFQCAPQCARLSARTSAAAPVTLGSDSTRGLADAPSRRVAVQHGAAWRRVAPRGARRREGDLDPRRGDGATRVAHVYTGLDDPACGLVWEARGPAGPHDVPRVQGMSGDCPRPEEVHPVTDRATGVSTLAEACGRCCHRRN